LILRFLLWVTARIWYTKNS